MKGPRWVFLSMVSEHEATSVSESTASDDSITLLRGGGSIASSPARARQGRWSLPRYHRRVHRASVSCRQRTGSAGVSRLPRTASDHRNARKLRHRWSRRFGGRPATLLCALRNASRRLPRATWPVLAAVHRPGHDPAGFSKVSASGSGRPGIRQARGRPADGPVSALADRRRPGRSLRPFFLCGRQRWRAPSLMAASSGRPGSHSIHAFPARASRCPDAGASSLPSGNLRGTISDALIVVDRGARGPLCSNMAVGVDRQPWWNPLRTGREDGQRSCGPASRQYRLHAPAPCRASLLRAYRNVQPGHAVAGSQGSPRLMPSVRRHDADS
jgi:hypothetical protein